MTSPSAPEEIDDLRQRTHDFIRTTVIPAEPAPGDRLDRPTRVRLQEAAKDAGVFAPHVPREFGGQGVPIGRWSPILQEAGYSPIGASALNCMAPDEGNMHMLNLIGTEDQKSRYLAPLAAGEVRSCFAMTEPHPGAGSDPAALTTEATRVDGGWRISGHKRFISGADGAAFAIVMARNDADDDVPEGATMFLVDMSNPGIRLGEHIHTIDHAIDGGHPHLYLDDCFVPREAVLGEAGLGFRYAQVRLGPARLTHCMRWLGLADRALEMCKKQLETRTSFGKILSQHQLVQKKIADAVHGLHAGNLMTLHCAWMLEEGRTREARGYSSMCKNHVATLLCDVLDDCIQIHGGLGFSDDMPFAQWYRHARAARIADGPEEVHDVVVARDWLAGKLTTLV